MRCDCCAIFAVTGCGGCSCPVSVNAILSHEDLLLFGEILRHLSLSGLDMHDDAARTVIYDDAE